MQIKQIRLCVECGKQHDTGIENKKTGNFDKLNTCIDCLMRKCYFTPFTEQIYLEAHSLESDNSLFNS